MTGKYDIRIENRSLVYEFTIRRNITVIRGNSATGKTTLIEMISSYERDGEESGISLYCKKDCTALTDVRWEENLGQIHDSIVFIDEDYRFVRSQKFAEMVKASDDYFILVTRDNLYNLPYSVDEIYGIHVSGKYQSLKKTYNELYHIYGNVSMTGYSGKKQTKRLIVEDSNSGYDFFSEISLNAECTSAGGKTRIFRTLLENKDRCCLVIADGAAFGPEMEKIYEMIQAGYDVALYLPESFEWLILRSGLIDGNRVRDILEHPEDYIDSQQYFSWENFFAALLIHETEGTYLRYSKDSLNDVYLNEKEKKAIIDVLPEGVRKYITGDEQHA